jgi:hypothetical protein
MEEQTGQEREYTSEFYEREASSILAVFNKTPLIMMGADGTIHKREKTDVIYRKPVDDELMKPQYYLEKFIDYTKNLGFPELEFSESLRFEGALYQLFQTYFTGRDMMMIGPDDPYPWHLLYGIDGVKRIDSKRIKPVPIGLYLGCSVGFGSEFECTKEGVAKVMERVLNEYALMLIEMKMESALDFDMLKRAFLLGGAYGNLRVASGLVKRSSMDECTDCRVGVQALIDAANAQIWCLAQIDENALLVGRTMYELGFFKGRFDYDPPRSRMLIMFMGKPGLHMGPEIFGGIKVLHQFSRPIQEGMMKGKEAYFSHLELIDIEWALLHNLILNLSRETRLSRQEVESAERGAVMMYNKDVGDEVLVRREDVKDEFKEMYRLIESKDILISIAKREYKKSYVYDTVSLLDKEEKERNLKMAKELGFSLPKDSNTLTSEFLRKAFPLIKKKKEEILKKQKLPPEL